MTGTESPAKALCLAIGLALSGLCGAAAQDDLFPIDEADLFADTSSLRPQPGLDAPKPGGMQAASVPASAGENADGNAERTLAFSGSVLAHTSGGLSRAYFEEPDIADASMASGIVADGHLDARLLRGFKAYSTLEWGSDTVWRVPELFLDANIAHRVYFRMGKQVLQWGRCQFFNPTDFVNVEAKTFFRRIGDREGAYGLKAHVPFGTSQNIYAFLDMGGVTRPDSLSLALKYETLLGGTEVAASVLAAPYRAEDLDFIYGLDFSSRVLGWDITGEGALHRRQTRYALSLGAAGEVPRFTRENLIWVPKAALGLSRQFGVNGVPDRLLVLGEYYFNGAGSAQSELPWPDDFGSAMPVTDLTTLLLRSAVEAGYYRPNDYSRHYAALFTTFGRFLRSDIDLLFNAIGNINQSCAQLSAGVAYRDINDFTLTFYLNGFVGGNAAEYTFTGTALQAQLLAQVVF